MKATATALCALLLATPALAQQDVFRDDAPESNVTPSEQPPRDTSRSEAVDVLPLQARQALAALSRNAVAAQQFGNLAATKQAPAAIRDLGDGMVTINSEINERLDALAAERGIVLPQRMPERDQNFFEALAETNRDEFARGLVAWVNDAYPTTIRALQAVADQPGFRELAETALPVLRDQLRATQQIAQAYAQGGTLQAETPSGQAGGPADPRRDVGTDPQSRTQSLPGGGQAAAIPAGEPNVTNAGGLLAAIANVDTEMRQLGMISDLQPDQVRIVPAQEVLPTDDVAVIRDSIRQNQDQITRLRQVVGQEDSLNTALQTNQATPRDVIAMDVLDEGIILYTMGPQQAETPGE